MDRYFEMTIMRHLVLALLLAAIAGCATPEAPTEIRYLPPDDAAPPPAEVRVPQSEPLVWEQLLGSLEASPLTLERTDRGAGLIVARYSGDPEPYVDCGWIMAYGPGDAVRTPGASAEAAFGWREGGQWLDVTRRLELNGRMVVRLRPAGAATLLALDSTYVVTKALDVETAGEPMQGSQESVSFTTGEQGRFTSGTLCRSTGELERLAAGAVASAVATRSSAAAPQVALNCATADAAYCEARDLIARFEEANRQQELGLALTTVGGAMLLEGDPLNLDISFPNYDSFLHVAYIQRSGEVGHILPGHGQLWPARAANYVERTGYDIAPPYGTEMILALATEEPLFSPPRPQFEDAEAFLDALRQRLAELTARDPGMRIAASHLLVTTAPRSATTTAAAY
jgi:hypothetical protein